MHCRLSSLSGPDAMIPKSAHGDGFPTVAHSRHQGSHTAPVPEPHAPDGLTAILFGSAIAAGQNTSATGSLTNTVETVGTLTIAFGEAKFTANADSLSDSVPAADASTAVEVRGADIVVEINQTENAHNDHSAWASSITDYFAIDFPNFTEPNGPVTVMLTPTSPAINHYFPDGPLSPLGNFAEILSTATADAGVALSSTQSLTIENHFSFISGFSIVAI
jgi:hypothetical protein